MQELGEDVAAITAAKDAESPTSVTTPTNESTSPQQRKKRGAKVEKQLKIKLWGKGLRSKENAEPMRKEDTTEGEEDVGMSTTLTDKMSPTRKVPEDISHLFTPHSVAGSRGTRLSSRGSKTPSTPSVATTVGVSSSASQHLELINGKRFISVGSSPESVRQSPANHFADDVGVGGKRALSSPGSKQSPKRAKVGLTSTPFSYQFRNKAEGFGLFASEQFNNFVSHAYHGLLHVFRYLTVQELMVAAGVCKLWRDLALHHSHVRMYLLLISLLELF